VESTFTARVWRHEGEAGWYFLTLPAEVADEIEDLPEPGRGFGSRRVEVTIGATTWCTSVFPSAEHRSFVLPVKKAVRTAEGLDDDARVRVTLRLIDG
jgi:hypothetical protein